VCVYEYGAESYKIIHMSHTHKMTHDMQFFNVRVYAAHTATHCNTLQHTATHCNTLFDYTRVHLYTAHMCSLCEWVGGWVDGWVVGWLGGWVGGWVCVCVFVGVGVGVGVYGVDTDEHTHAHTHTHTRNKQVRAVLNVHAYMCTAMCSV